MKTYRNEGFEQDVIRKCKVLPRLKHVTMKRIHSNKDNKIPLQNKEIRKHYKNFDEKIKIQSVLNLKFEGDNK